jgi:hypothetical protein
VSSAVSVSATVVTSILHYINRNHIYCHLYFHKQCDNAVDDNISDKLYVVMKELENNFHVSQ